MTGGEDTDPSGQFTVERVACVGSCSLAPVMTIDEKIYGRLSALTAVGVLRDFVADERRSATATGTRDAAARRRRQPQRSADVASGGASKSASASGRAASPAARSRCRPRSKRRSARSAAARRSRPVGCAGFCHREPLVEVVDGGKRVLYGNVSPADARKLVREHVGPRGVAPARPRRRRRRARPAYRRRRVGADCERRRSRRRRYISQAGAHRPRELRRGRSAVAGRLPRARRVPGARSVPVAHAGAGDRGDPRLGAARSRRRGVPDRGQVGPGAAGRRRHQVRDRQRRRGRSRGVHGSRRARGRSVPRHRGPDDRRVRDRRAARASSTSGASTRSPCGTCAPPSSRPRPPACWANGILGSAVQLHAAGARRRRRVRVRRGDRADPVAGRAAGHAEAAAAVPRAVRVTAGSRRSSTTSRRWRACRGSSARAPRRSPRWAPSGRRAPRCSRSPARSRAAASSKSRWASPSARSSRRSGGGIKGGRAFKAVLAGGPSGGCIPASLADTRVDYEELASTGRHHGLGRPRRPRRSRLRRGHRALLPALHPGRVVRQVHVLPRRHAADARDPRAHLRGQGPARRPRDARDARRGA